MARRLAKMALLITGAAITARALDDSLNKIQLQGKVVLITGGTRGLGLIMARMLAAEGAKVVICGKLKENLQKASEDLSYRGTDFLAIPCDITNQQQVKDMVRQIKGKMGSVDIIINNASVIQAGPIESMTKSDYESAMKVHFWGPYYVVTEVLPEMMRRETGRIVNIASIGGKISFPHLLPYNTSKYALSGFSEGLAAEVDKYNIKVTTVYPGLMRTGSPRNIDVKGQHEKEYAWFKTLDSIPGLSMDAQRAARQIIESMKRGRGTLTLTLPAKLALAAHGIAPGLTVSILDLINLILPSPDGAGTESKKGYESESILSTLFMTDKTDEAAKKTMEK